MYELQVGLGYFCGGLAGGVYGVGQGLRARPEGGAVLVYFTVSVSHPKA